MFQRIICASVLVTLFGCGPDKTITTPGTGGELTVNPNVATLGPNGVVTFSASGAGFLDGVHWSVEAGPGRGSINSEGRFVAPSEFGDSEITITATSALDPSKSATASVRVDVSRISVSVSPESGELASGATRQFSASVTGALDKGVAWSVSRGSITQSGIYTAPTGIAGAVTVTIEARSQIFATAIGRAQVAITPAPPPGGELTADEARSLEGSYNYGFGVEFMTILFAMVLAEPVRIASELTGFCPTLTGTLTQAGSDWRYTASPADRMVMRQQNGDVMEYRYDRYVGCTDGFDALGEHEIAGTWFLPVEGQFVELRIESKGSVTTTSSNERSVRSVRRMSASAPEASMDVTSTATLGGTESGETAIWEGQCRGTVASALDGITSHIDEDWNATYWSSGSETMWGSRIVSRSGVMFRGVSLQFQGLDTYAVCRGSNVANPSEWRARGAVLRNGAPAATFAFRPEPRTGRPCEEPKLAIRIGDDSVYELGPATVGFGLERPSPLARIPESPAVRSALESARRELAPRSVALRDVHF